MSVLVVGVNHRTAPLDLLERIALDAQEVAKAVSGLVALDSVREAVVLSTCNRTSLQNCFTKALMTFSMSLQRLQVSI